jgi:hypothetical protein
MLSTNTVDPFYSLLSKPNVGHSIVYLLEMSTFRYFVNETFNFFVFLSKTQFPFYCLPTVGSFHRLNTVGPFYSVDKSFLPILRVGLIYYTVVYYSTVSYFKGIVSRD